MSASVLVLLSCCQSGCSLVIDFDKDATATPADADPVPPDAVSTSPDSATCAPPPCPSPASGFSVCGRLYDLSTSLAITGKANELTVEMYDVDELRQGGNPLAAAQLDDCGWFAATDLAPGSVVAVSDDRVADPGQWTRTAVYVDGLVGQVVSSDAFAVLDSREQSWSDQANLSPGFAAEGSVLMVFVDSAQPAVGPFLGTPAFDVTPELAGLGNIDSRCFDDSGFLDRTTVDPQATATGQSGSCLVERVAGGGTRLTGQGGPRGCNWPEVRVPRINDLLHVAVLTAQCQ